MTADSYKPTVSVVMLPINEEDKFKPGEEYSSPRIKPESASNLMKPFQGLFLFTVLIAFRV